MQNAASVAEKRVFEDLGVQVAHWCNCVDNPVRLGRLMGQNSSPSTTENSSKCAEGQHRLVLGSHRLRATEPLGAATADGADLCPREVARQRQARRASIRQLAIPDVAEPVEAAQQLWKPARPVDAVPREVHVMRIDRIALRVTPRRPAHDALRRKRKSCAEPVTGAASARTARKSTAATVEPDVPMRPEGHPA